MKGGREYWGEFDEEIYVEMLTDFNYSILLSLSVSNGVLLCMLIIPMYPSKCETGYIFECIHVLFNTG